MNNFTFENKLILDYFEGNGEPPVDILLYLHEHPLVRPNFVMQLETQILEATDKLNMLGPNSSPVKELIDIAIKMGQLLPLIRDRENAIKTLEQFKRSFLLCKKLGVSIKPA